MKKIAAISLALVLLLGIVAGCGQSTPPASQAAPAASASPEASQAPAGDSNDPFPNKKLNIAIFEGGFGRAYWDDIVAQFEAAYPGVKVNMDIDPEIGNILAPQIAVGDWPDFISLSDTERSGVVASMIKNQELLDLTDVYDGEALDRPGTKLRDIIVSGMLDSTKFSPYGDGKVYLAPFNVGPMGMVYNKTLFEEKGWKLPSTWDDFFALDEELKKPENYVDIDGQQVKRSLFTYQGIYAGYLESVFWPAVAGAGGMNAIGDICTYKEGSFSTPQVKELVSTFAKIGTQGYLMEGTVALNHTQSQTDMMMGKALFIPNGTWLEGEMADAPREDGFEFGILPPPTMKSGEDHYVLSSYEQFEIPKQAKNPELAKEFLRFLYTKESITSFAKNANGTIAVTDAKDIAKDDLTPGVYGMFSAYETGKFMLMNFESLPENCKVNVSAVVFDDNMGPLMTGSLSPDDYCKKVEDAFAEIRADMAAAG